MTVNIIRENLKKKISRLEKSINVDNNLPLSVIQYDHIDIENCLNTLTRGWPTIGKEVQIVEKKIEKYLKVKNAIMLNSGGSANYLILYLLTSVYAKKRINYREVMRLLHLLLLGVQLLVQLYRMV